MKSFEVFVDNSGCIRMYQRQGDTLEKVFSGFETICGSLRDAVNMIIEDDSITDSWECDELTTAELSNYYDDDIEYSDYIADGDSFGFSWYKSNSFSVAFALGEDE